MQLKERIRHSSGRESVDRFCGDWHGALAKEFAAQPGFGFFDDGDEPNALATPAALIPGGPDGTVLLGIGLLNHEVGPRREQFALPQKPGELVVIPSTQSEEAAYPRLAIILAHEWGHILQYRSGMTPDGPWQMEPFADFLAGWALARQLSKLVPSGHGAFTNALLSVLSSQNAVQTIFAKGDTLFYDKDHHGEPEFRATMVRAGYEDGALSVEAAFKKGKRMLGLQ